MSWNGIIRADARQIPLADSCVQCVVTSPPYWGLRDYSMCSCRSGRVQHASSTMAGSQAGTPSEFSAADPNCLKCGGTGHDLALQQQIGLERTPEEYVASILDVFREVWRVLKPDGVLWLNLGDTYAAARSYQVPDSKYKDVGNKIGPEVPPGLKPKDLVGIPWRIAFALQADGWYLRSDIIWSKPNPMPESVTDRPTKAHEYIFLLTKSERYFYDADAIAEPLAPASASRYDYAFGGAKSEALIEANKDGIGVRARVSGFREADGKDRKTSALEPQNGQRRMVDSVQAARDSGAPHDQPFGLTRNKRSVWTVNTQPYPEAHYATFPEEIPEICIKAGSRPGDLILDPFFGSGTVGRVAERLSRRWVGLDLGYQELQKKRFGNLQKELLIT